MRSKLPVNDGKHHVIIAERNGQNGTLIVDEEEAVKAKSGGSMSHLNGNGNIYLGKSCVPSYPPYQSCVFPRSVLVNGF